jgi:hypothetical protein
MMITKESGISGIEHTRSIPCTQYQLDKWQVDGQLIQQAMPHLSADDREFLMTGITPQEWEAMF